MAKRDDVVPEDLVIHLQRRIKGFKKEPVGIQMMLAKMIWVGGHKSKRHTQYEGAMSFTYQELYKAFGKGGFDEINKRLEMFDVTPNWSKDQGFTKAYWFTSKVQAARDEYFSKVWRKVTRVLLLDGSVQKTLPRPIGSRASGAGKRKSMAKVWGKARMAPVVRVDRPTLQNLRKVLKQWIKDWQEGRRPQDLFMSYPNEEYLQYLVDMVAKILRMSHTDVAGHGCIAQQYQESPSGRLYGLGLTLQNAPELIKQAALSGLWEYDFICCHYAILDQMAAKHGFDCRAIKHYLTHTDEVRQTIADEVGIAMSQAKTCLVAILYGAKASLHPDDAIPDEIGVDAAKRLYQHPIFKALKDEVAKSRSAIIKAWPRSANGSLVNACGKAIKGDAKNPEILAHLLQGVEAAALRSVFDAHPGEIVLLQHDGFTAHSKLDLKSLETLVHQATGYQLHLTVKQLRLTPERQFLKAEQNAQKRERKRERKEHNANRRNH